MTAAWESFCDIAHAAAHPPRSLTLPAAVERAETEEQFLARRFATGDALRVDGICLHCGYGPAGHQAPLDRYGARALRCIADDAVWDTDAERTWRNRKMGY